MWLRGGGVLYKLAGAGGGYLFKYKAYIDMILVKCLNNFLLNEKFLVKYHIFNYSFLVIYEAPSRETKHCLCLIL